MSSLQQGYLLGPAEAKTAQEFTHFYFSSPLLLLNSTTISLTPTANF